MCPSITRGWHRQWPKWIWIRICDTCDMKWYVMIWYVMIWYMIWYDIWYDMICYDMLCYDMIWYDMIYDMLWYDIWYDMIWYDMISWCDVMWCDMIWYDMIQIQIQIHKMRWDEIYDIWCNTIWYYTIWFDNIWIQFNVSLLAAILLSTSSRYWTDAQMSNRCQTEGYRYFHLLSFRNTHMCRIV